MMIKLFTLRSNKNELHKQPSFNGAGCAICADAGAGAGAGANASARHIILVFFARYAPYWARNRIDTITSKSSTCMFRHCQL